MAQPAPAVDDEEQSRNMRYFEIPTQPLTSAVTSFGDQAAIQVTVDGSILSGLTSTPVRGNLTPVEALNRLLNGTGIGRSEEHTSELPSLMRISYAVLCLKKKTNNSTQHNNHHRTRK